MGSWLPDSGVQVARRVMKSLKVVMGSGILVFSMSFCSAEGYFCDRSIEQGCLYDQVDSDTVLLRE